MSYFNKEQDKNVYSYQQTLIYFITLFTIMSFCILLLSSSLLYGGEVAAGVLIGLFFGLIFLVSTKEIINLFRQIDHKGYFEESPSYFDLN